MLYNIIVFLSKCNFFKVVQLGGDSPSFKERLSEVVCVCSLSGTPIISYTEISAIVWKISNVSTASTLTCQLTSTWQESLSINCCLCTCATFTWGSYPSYTMGKLYLEEEEITDNSSIIALTFSFQCSNHKDKHSILSYNTACMASSIHDQNV